MTPEEAQATGRLNQALENTLSSVEIRTKVEMKSGKTFTEWEIKAKHEDVHKASEAAQKEDTDLRVKYYGSVPL